jgi:hypothetical protein
LGDGSQSRSNASSPADFQQYLSSGNAPEEVIECIEDVMEILEDVRKAIQQSEKL